MKREIKFSLVFRDMWQSAGKYVPTVDQLTRVAPAIIEMGCFARVETNGGGFEQVNLLFGENPNRAVREWTKPFHEAGIQTHMLDRALNGLRMSPVPDDVRQLFYQVKKAQGTDIARTFCGLNDVRNIAPSIRYAKAAGMISQCSLCITHSPIHTVEYYTKMAMELIELGADEICIKDMAGIGRPHSLGQIVANIKAKHPEIPVQYHSHAGPGFNVASILEVCNAGCDYIDVGMEPLSWGTGHADLLTVQAMLKDAGYKLTMPVNKRNWRKQPVHLQGARAIQEINDKANGTNWREGNGRPKGSGTAQARVYEWRQQHPEGRKADCHRETGLDPKTVRKWWDCPPPAVRFENGHITVRVSPSQELSDWLLDALHDGGQE